MRIMSASSWRVYEKCSQRLLLTSTPSFVSSLSSTCLTSAEQPPHPVEALVDSLMPPRVVTPACTEQQIAPLVTSKQEQICALSGKASTPIIGLVPPSLTGKISCSGASGKSIRLTQICCSVP